MGPLGIRRTAAVLMVAWGALLIVVSVLGIPNARATQRLLDGARPLVAPAYLERERALIVEGRAALQQLVDEGLPRLAARMHVSDAQLQAQLSSKYPDVAKGIAALPTIFDTTDASLANLQNHRSDFHDADTFPVPDVPRLAESIGGIVFGAVLIGLGCFAWLPRSRWPMAAGLTLTLIAAVLPLAFWLPGKAGGAADMAASLNLTKETAVATRASFDTVDRFTKQLQDQLLPDAAAAAGTTPRALRADVEQGLDQLQAGVRDYPTTVRLFTPDVELRESRYPDFQRVRAVPVVALTWAFIAGNALVALAAATAYLRGRESRNSLPSGSASTTPSGT